MFTSFIVLCLLLALGSCNGQDWVQLPGSAQHLSAKSDGLFTINVDEQVFRWNLETNKWQLLKGDNFRCLGGTIDGYVWTTIHDYVPRRLDISANVWEHPGNSKGGGVPKLRNINAISKDNAIAADVNNDIWTFRNNEWVKQGDNIGVWAAMGTDGDRWAINAQGRIFRLESGGWIEKSTPYTPNQTPNDYQIDVQNADRVIVTNGQLAYILREYSWSEKNFYKRWDMIDGYARRVTINQTHIFRIGQEVSREKRKWAFFYALF